MSRPSRCVGMFSYCAGVGLLLACLGVAAPGWAQDDSGFLAPIEDPMDGAPADGASIQGGADAVAISFYSSPRPMYATTAALVRSGPGTGYAQIGTIRYGGQVTVLGSADGGSWLYLEMAGGAMGFTASNLLSTSPPTASGGSGGTGGTSSSPPLVCAPGEVVVHMADGTSICARLR